MTELDLAKEIALHLRAKYDEDSFDAAFIDIGPSDTKETLTESCLRSLCVDDGCIDFIDLAKKILDILKQ